MLCNFLVELLLQLLQVHSGLQLGPSIVFLELQVLVALNGVVLGLHRVQHLLGALRVGRPLQVVEALQPVVAAGEALLRVTVELALQTAPLAEVVGVEGLGLEQGQLLAEVVDELGDLAGLLGGILLTHGCNYN